jgi:hypothetical protein
MTSSTDETIEIRTLIQMNRRDTPRLWAGYWLRRLAMAIDARPVLALEFDIRDSDEIPMVAEVVNSGVDYMARTLHELRCLEALDEMVE